MKGGVSNRSAVMALLGLLMSSHLLFLGINAEKEPGGVQAFQRAAETYVAILLAMLAPLAPQ
jgi:hypothetical protein